MRRRAIGFAAVAASGAVLVAGASAAQAQIPATVGDGIKTGQMGVQLFNYGGWLNNAGEQGPAPPALFQNLTQSCLGGPGSHQRRHADDAGLPPRASQGAVRVPEGSKGVTNVELFGHSGFPASNDIPGLTAYRALLDEFGLHAGGWHGSNERGGVGHARHRGQDPRCRLHRLWWRPPTPRASALYDAVLRSAEALNRLGKRAVEAGVGPAYIHNHTEEFDRDYVDDGVLKDTYDILMERTDPRDVRRRARCLLVVGRVQRRDRHRSRAAFINKWGSSDPDAARQGRHQHRGPAHADQQPLRRPGDDRHR